MCARLHDHLSQPTTISHVFVDARPPHRVMREPGSLVMPGIEILKTSRKSHQSWSLGSPDAVVDKHLADSSKMLEGSLRGWQSFVETEKRRRQQNRLPGVENEAEHI